MSLNKWENLQNLQILDKVLGLPPQGEEPKTFTSQATVLIQITFGKSTVLNPQIVFTEFSPRK